MQRAAPSLLPVDLRHRTIDTLAHDELDRVRGNFDADLQQLRLGPRRTGEDVSCTMVPPLRFADANPDPAEVEPLGMLIDRAEAVVTSGATTDFDPHDAWREIEFIMDNDETRPRRRRGSGR